MIMQGRVDMLIYILKVIKNTERVLRIMLYDKEFGWSLSLAPGRWPLNPWTFPSNRSVFITHGGPFRST